jgi:hypothetical protein
MEVFIHFRFVILRSISVSDCYSNRGADHAEHADETDDAAVYLFHFVQIQLFCVGIHNRFPPFFGIYCFSLCALRFCFFWDFIASVTGVYEMTDPDGSKNENI